MSPATPERKYPRVKLSAESAIPVVISSNPRDVRSGQIRVLGAGGAFLQGCDGYTVGSIVQLRFTLPTVEHEIACSAIVRGRFPGEGVGLQFTRLASRHREQVVAEVMGHQAT